MISIVTPCHGEAAELSVLVDSLRYQRHYDKGTHSRDGTDVYWECRGPCCVEWELLVCSDGVFCGDRSLFQDTRLRLIECRQERSTSGHHTRETGIKAANGDYVVLTNSDNYFVAGFLSSVERNLRDNIGILTWNCVNNLWKWGTQGGCEMKRGRIDLSCAAVRRDIATGVGFPWRHYDADWDYLSGCRNLCCRRRLHTKHIDEVLVVHN